MFALRETQTSVRTELLAGLTTYLTMAYISVVNYGIMATAGIDHGAAFVATCVTAAPALVFVACLMARALRDIAWDDATDVVPAVITAITTPLAFSVATGIGLGFIVFVVKLLAGRVREIAGAAWVIAALSAWRFAVS